MEPTVNEKWRLEYKKKPLIEITYLKKASSYIVLFDSLAFLDIYIVNDDKNEVIAIIFVATLCNEYTK